MVKQACQKSNLITDLTSHKHFPDFHSLMSLEKTQHVIIYFSDLWNYVLNNLNSTNVKDFASFLLLSRRINFSFIFEYHEFPFSLSQKASEIFSFYLKNATLIVIMKALTDEYRLITFKRRFLQNHIQNFDKGQKIGEIISQNSANPHVKAYICLQKDLSQRHRLIRLDLFGQNVINILD